MSGITERTWQPAHCQQLGSTVRPESRLILPVPTSYQQGGKHGKVMGLEEMSLAAALFQLPQTIFFPFSPSSCHTPSNIREANRHWGGTRALCGQFSVALPHTVTAGSSSSCAKANHCPSWSREQGRREAARLNMKALKTKGI